MRAWRVHEYGEPTAVLSLEQVDEPAVGRDEVRIAVEAVSLNFADILLCRGEYQVKPPFPFSPGLEVAGRVVEAGPDATTPVGARVVAMPVLPGGGMAEQVVVPERAVFPVPDSMAPGAAAALHVAYQTGHLALHHRGQLRAGETLLVHAGAGGVGSAAIQLGLAAGARVIATAGGARKVGILRDLGVDVAIDYREEDFVDIVKDATDGRGADVVYDPVGGDTFDRTRRCIAWEGRILVIGFAGGRIADAPTNHVLVKNYAVVGVHWGAYLERAPHVVRQIHGELIGLHEAGAISPLISEELPFDRAPDALEALATRRTWGHVVLRW